MRRLRLSAYAALRMSSDADITPVEPTAQYSTGEVVVIPIVGPLEHRLSKWCCSYQWILGAAQTVLTQGRPKAIVLDLSSPGGDVEGLFSTCRQLRALFEASGVPTVAYVHTACSASYALACTCDQIVIDSTGQAGSVGVITELTDSTENLAQAGVKVRLVTSGARKADGNPANPLTDEAVATRQEAVNKLANSFFEYVAERRGLEPAALAALQAATFIGDQAVAVGLADSVSDFGSFVAQVSTGEIMDPEQMMSALKAKLESGDLSAQECLQALGLAAAKAEGDEEKPEAKAEGDEEKPEAKAEGDEEKPEAKDDTEGAKALGLARMAALAGSDKDYSKKISALLTRPDFSAVQVIQLMGEPLAVVNYAVQNLPKPKAAAAPTRPAPKPAAVAAPEIPAQLAALLGISAGAGPAATSAGVSPTDLKSQVVALDAIEPDKREVDKISRAFGEQKSQFDKTAIAGNVQFFGAVPRGAHEYK